MRLNKYNQKDSVGINDAGLVLQIMAGMVPLKEVFTTADANDDDKIGIMELTFI